MATKKRNLIIKTKAIRNQMVKKMVIRAKASRNQAKIKKKTHQMVPILLKKIRTVKIAYKDVKLNSSSSRYHLRIAQNQQLVNKECAFYKKWIVNNYAKVLILK